MEVIYLIIYLEFTPQNTVENTIKIFNYFRNRTNPIKYSLEKI